MRCVCIAVDKNPDIIYRSLNNIYAESQTMLLKGKTAVIYGGSGAIGSAVAHAFVDAGAEVFLAARTLAKLEKTAKDIGGHNVHVAQVDALDEAAVNAHMDAVVAKKGSIDIVLNAVGIMH